MAQAPVARPGIPPAQPPAQPPAARTQVNIHGVAPEPNMAPPDDTPEETLGDNTRAEMTAGKKNLDHYSKRNNAEHEAGQRAVQQRSGATKTNPLE
jgi:hypothetical protein